MKTFLKLFFLISFLIFSKFSFPSTFCMVVDFKLMQERYYCGDAAYFFKVENNNLYIFASFNNSIVDSFPLIDIEKFYFVIEGSAEQDIVSNIKNVKLYPNPSSGNIHVDFDLKSNEGFNIEIVNALGQKVANVPHQIHQAGQHQISIDTNALGLSKGLYLLNFHLPNERFTKTFIIQ